MQNELFEYCKYKNIKAGPIFINSEGNLLESSYVSIKVKELADKAGIEKNKISIHAFRDLFIQNESQKLKEEQEDSEDEII